MRAIQYTEHGDVDRLHVAERDAPHAGPGQIRIAVRAAGVNPIDWKIVGGIMSGGEPLAAPTVPGFDAAGVVEEVGDGVADVAVGDEVLGLAASGAAAEQAVLDVWARKPDGVSFEQAAAWPTAVETAYRCLELLGLRDGATLLVDGAAGGVGQALVQLASARGLRVLGTASEPNHQRLRELGATATTYGDGLADRVRELAPDGVDGAVDTAGKGSLPTLAELTGDPARVVTIADFSGSVPGAQITTGGETDRGAALREGAELAGRGGLDLPVQRTFALEDAAEAYALSREGHVAGKLVLVV